MMEQTDLESMQIDANKFETIIDQWGSIGFFRNHPDLKIVVDGVEQDLVEYLEGKGYSEQRIFGLLIETEFWKSQDAISREFEESWWAAGGGTSRGYNPEVPLTDSQRALIDTNYDAIVRSISKKGIVLSEPQIIALAREATRLNMDSFEIDTEIFELFDPSSYSSIAGDGLNTYRSSGDLLDQKQALQGRASNYMLALSDADAWDQTFDLKRGLVTEEGLDAGYAEMAANQYPALRPLMEQGISPKTFFYPYKAEQEKLLERPLDYLGADRGMFEMLFIPDPITGVPRLATYTENQAMTKLEDEWQFTENGHEDYRTVGESILKKFGAVG